MQLKRQLVISRYETVWLILQKLRRAMVPPLREELHGEVWGREPRHDDRSVDVYVSRRRSKLRGSRCRGSGLSTTHSGIGYRVAPEE